MQNVTALLPELDVGQVRFCPRTLTGTNELILPARTDLRPLLANPRLDLVMNRHMNRLIWMKSDLERVGVSGLVSRLNFPSPSIATNGSTESITHALICILTVQSVGRMTCIHLTSSFPAKDVRARQS